MMYAVELRPNYTPHPESGRPTFTRVGLRACGTAPEAEREMADICVCVKVGSRELVRSDVLYTADYN